MTDNELSELKDTETILAKIVEYAKCGLAHNCRDHELAFKWGDVLRAIIQQRDTAWKELREIREAIKADENESTADEVRSLVAKRDELLAALDSILQHPLDENNWITARLIRKKYIQGETCALCGGSGKLDGESCFNCEGMGTL